MRQAQSQSRAAQPVRVPKVKANELAQFTYQFGVLIGARISIGEGLMSIASQETNQRFKQVIMDVATRIESGERIASAMEPYRPLFGDVYIESIRAAEETGNMVKVLDHLSDMLEQAHETKRELRSALMYPICVVSVLVGAVLFLVTFVIPKFAHMFEARGVDLPIVTKLLMIVGDGLKDYWWVVLLGVVVLVSTTRRFVKTSAGRDWLDRKLHKIPYLSRVLTSLAISRFASVFAISHGSGLGLIECLEMAGRATGRPMLIRDTELLADQVRKGGRLAETLPRCNYLTPFTKRMISAGEEASELTRLSGVVARHYNRETEHLVKDAATVIEPVLIVGIALIVLIVALSIFLPMWNMISIME